MNRKCKKCICLFCFRNRDKYDNLELGLIGCTMCVACYSYNLNCNNFVDWLSYPLERSKNDEYEKYI